jgi:hypothetical protein
MEKQTVKEMNLGDVKDLKSLQEAAKNIPPEVSKVSLMLNGRDVTLIRDYGKSYLEEERSIYGGYGRHLDVSGPAILLKCIEVSGPHFSGIEGNSVIGSAVELTSSHVYDSVIGNDSSFYNSVVSDSVIGCKVALINAGLSGVIVSDHTAICRARIVKGEGQENIQVKGNIGGVICHLPMMTITNQEQADFAVKLTREAEEHVIKSFEKEEKFKKRLIESITAASIGLDKKSELPEIRK